MRGEARGCLTVITSDDHGEAIMQPTAYECLTAITRATWLTAMTRATWLTAITTATLCLSRFPSLTERRTWGIPLPADHPTEQASVTP